MTTNLQVTIKPSQHKDYIEMLVNRRALLMQEVSHIEAYLIEIGRLKRHRMERRQPVKQ